MATGGIFTIITNDGKQDRMLMATALLHDRLDRIWRAKSAAKPGVPIDDISVLPSLIDIEKTHILFTNAHFKPFAAIGFEYNKVKPASGSASGALGSGTTLQFSIPQFGDFFHDIAFHCKLSQPTVTAGGGVLAPDTPAMRWCAWPGERLLKKVQQEVNGNPLDEYNLHATVAHREYRVSPNKLTAWKRCVGQEEVADAFVRQAEWAASATTSEQFRVKAQVFNGHQTPTATKTATVEMFVPLLFWYNKDVRLAVPSVAIPYGQRFINIELASAAEMVGLYPRGANLDNWAAPGGTLSDTQLSEVELYINNIFVNPEVHKIYIKRVGFSLIRVHRQQVFPLAGSTSSGDLHLQQLKWPIEYLFVGAKIRDYYAGSTDALKSQYLDVWDRYSVYAQTFITQAGQTVNKESLLCVSATAGTLGIGQAVFTAAGETSAALLGTAVTAQAISAGDIIVVNGMELAVKVGVAAGGAVTTITVHNGPTVTIAATNAIALAARKVVRQGTEYALRTWSDTLDTISIQAHGIDIYKEFPAKFFNAYTPYHYGGSNINAPQDQGSLFVPFCLYPGTYQPSGHINVSRAREFFIKYTSTYFGNNAVSGSLVVIASAINFLLISDGSAVLRYST